MFNGSVLIDENADPYYNSKSQHQQKRPVFRLI